MVVNYYHRNLFIFSALAISIRVMRAMPDRFWLGFKGSCAGALLICSINCHSVHAVAPQEQRNGVQRWRSLPQA